MPAIALPSEENGFLAEHIGLVRRSFYHWSGRDFVNPRMNDEEAARYLFTAPLALLTHDTQPDPVFNYANQTALSLFAMSWEEMTACPSRLSAETDHREAREALLRDVAEKGYTEDYAGIRIGRHGRRFMIEGAKVWNLIDVRGIHQGQAASFAHWRWL
ncbi:MAG: MEKHLA domain-containing protein [Methylococcus sp.]|nr:MAG: MEKHLA domain-containing protein [Methylococcus sp.]